MSKLSAEIILMIETYTASALWGSSLIDNPWFMIEPFKWEGALLEFLILDLRDVVQAETILSHLEDSRARLTGVKQLELHVQDNDLLPRILALFSHFTSLHTLKLQCHTYSPLSRTLKPFLAILPSLSIQYFILNYPDGTFPSRFTYIFMSLTPSIQQVTVHLAQEKFGVSTHFSVGMLDF
ncbi:hypothetical protein A0H81_13987 [Grifola frondosa]|uniref:Uncharacterized protein n=1 Tax=Grifola frondosa TaxID=5627 RepID=A0A1C7LMX4_GRIFR|nr:hypothetical protein A0H81_13987 [Grifola frondosa]